MASSSGVGVDVLVVGAGKAGVQTASSLRDESYGGTIAVIGEESTLPYDRPPLSKAYLTGEENAESVVLHGPGYYPDHGIDLIRGTPVVVVDRAASEVELADGRRIGYGQLVLATGARPRPVPFDVGTDRVAVLRSLADADALRERLASARTVVVIGGGFIGLEVAAVAATAFGCQVTLIEALPRLMSRSGLPESAACVLRHLEEIGVRVMLGTAVDRLVEDDAVTVMLAEGSRIPTDLVVWGTGVVPNAELADAAGLVVRGGVLVDATLRTADPRIWAAGDCAAVETGPGEYVRLESLQNATDQARHVARSIATDTTEPYRATPWFWSDQAGLRFQSVGNLAQADRTVVVGDPGLSSFTTLAFAGGHLLGGDSINAAGDHRVLRRLLSGDAERLERLTPELASSDGFDLRGFLSRAAV